MPLLTDSGYRPPLAARNGHLNTIHAGLIRRVGVPAYERQRITTPDGDFLDLDWLRLDGDGRGRDGLDGDGLGRDGLDGDGLGRDGLDGDGLGRDGLDGDGMGGDRMGGDESGRDRNAGNRIAILCHGLEGNSRRTYMSGMARALSASGWDVLSWNYRGCSGEPNRALRSYHSGETGDIGLLVDQVAGDYAAVALVGFSLGGNVVLKYLGEQQGEAKVTAAVAFSVPCDLGASSRFLGRPQARPYMARFMRSLRSKARQKAAQYPNAVDLTGLEQMKTFLEFDDRFTAPFNGFRDAEDYWDRASSRPFIPSIRRPVLIASALDDPFLPDSCYPVEEARESTWVTLETPRFGGHVAFVDGWSTCWSERRAVEYLNRHVGRAG